MPDVDPTATATRATPEVPKRLADERSYDVDPGRGWVLFAGIMIGIIGVLNVIHGIAAIDNSTFFVRDVKFVISDLKTWGWVLTVVGALQLITSVGIFRLAEWARWAGIAFASVNMIVQFFLLPAYPAASILIFFVDVIIIFGLLNYGGRDRYALH